MALTINGDSTAVNVRVNLSTCEKVRVNGNLVFHKDYDILNYIQSSGTQYIDTGKVTTSNTQWDLTVEMLGRGYNGMQLTNKLASFLIFSDSVLDGYACNDYNTLDYFGNTGKHKYSIRSGWQGYDGNQVGSSAYSVSGLSLTIGALNTNYSGVWDYISERIYRSTIYENGALVQDLMPARRKSDSHIGMYDIVTDQFYTNKGSGSFIAG